MGSNVSCAASGDIVTVIEQSLLRGSVEMQVNGSSEWRPVEGNVSVSGNQILFRHNTSLYIVGAPASPAVDACKLG